MKIAALAPWFGSKRTMAPTIISELGPHNAYWEPFCGSMAVLLAKPKCRMETVCDLHGDLINLARVVRDREASHELRETVRMMFCSDDELRLANAALKRTNCTDEMDVSRAATYFAASWMTRNGVAGLRESKTVTKLCVRWTNSGGSAGTRWTNAVHSIAAWHRRLQAVVVLRRDGFGVLEKIADEADAVIYCDPPYLVKSDEYQHDFKLADHERLANILQRFKRARVVLSYYDHPTLKELYPSWSIKDCSRLKNLGNTNLNKPKALAPEVLLVNRPGERTGLFE